GLDALLKTSWDKWWGRSKVAPISTSGAPGRQEFDFWPLILAGKGPTKVRIRLEKPEHFERNGRTFYRIRSQFIDDGRSQFVGQTYWLLEPIQEADGQAGLFVHSAFEPGVRLGSNYQKYWQGVSAATFGKINLTPIFAQMHVWVEDSDGAETFINGVNRGFHLYLAARHGWHPEGQSGSIKSGLPGLADYLVAATQAVPQPSGAATVRERAHD
ncbi:MAG: hypothetical protein ACR2L2_20355, partial [Acidobacteriota bacterium]